MMMPGAKNAVVDLVKLTGYCLDFGHPRGRHKARRFAEKLGITAENARILQAALLDAAGGNDAVLVGEDGYGRRFEIEFMLQGPRGEAVVRSGWIVRSGESFPRLTTCYVD